MVHQKIDPDNDYYERDEEVDDLFHTIHTQYNQWEGYVSVPHKNRKAESPIRFGNPAV